MRAIARDLKASIAFYKDREGVVHDRPIDSVDLVPTIGSILNFSAALSQGKPIAEIV